MTPKTMRLKAAEAMGWTTHQIEVCGLEDVAILPPNVSIDDEGAVWKHAGIRYPDYPTDANAALLLVERLAEEGLSCELNAGTDKTWECSFLQDKPVTVGGCDGVETFAVYHAADTMAEAITGAFLRVKGLLTDPENPGLGRE